MACGQGEDFGGKQRQSGMIQTPGKAGIFICPVSCGESKVVPKREDQGSQLQGVDQGNTRGIPPGYDALQKRDIPSTDIVPDEDQFIKSIRDSRQLILNAGLSLQ